MDEVRALRYRYPDGSVQAVFPMYVVEESERQF